MFPFGIDPRLIDDEFNGFMTLSSLDKVKVISKEFLVGSNKNTI